MTEEGAVDFPTLISVVAGLVTIATGIVATLAWLYRRHLSSRYPPSSPMHVVLTTGLASSAPSMGQLAPNTGGAPSAHQQKLSLLSGGNLLRRIKIGDFSPPPGDIFERNQEASSRHF